jgi:hypothetical protein
MMARSCCLLHARLDVMAGNLFHRRQCLVPICRHRHLSGFSRTVAATNRRCVQDNPHTILSLIAINHNVHVLWISIPRVDTRIRVPTTCQSFLLQWVQRVGVFICPSCRGARCWGSESAATISVSCIGELTM